MAYKDVGGFTIQSNDIHLHKKIEIKVESETSEILLPSGELFIISQDENINQNINKSTIQVYVNGLLQTKSHHYQEIRDDLDITKGKGINFLNDTLIIDDIVVLEWVNEL